MTVKILTGNWLVVDTASQKILLTQKTKNLLRTIQRVLSFGDVLLHEKL